MAKMTISVPDDLKARMDDIQGVNWSGVAQQAFELEVKAKSKGGNMEQVIERLRASKQQQEVVERPKWISAGRDWAMNMASYAELSSVGLIETRDILTHEFEGAQHLLGEIDKALYGDDGVAGRMQATELIVGFMMGKPSTRVLLAWIEGAQAVWTEVEDEI